MTVYYKNELALFGKITLNELNAKASYLKRIDRKFLLTSSEFKNILLDLKDQFQVLEINDKRVFSYDNIYMDTEDYLFYSQHQNKQESRTKIRTRLYEDSNIAFFEYKQKIDGVTQKYRYQFPVEEHGEMTKGKKRFFEGVWQSLYSGEKAPNISPAIRTKYQRITLVNNDGSERLTIDFNIKINNLRDKKSGDIDLKNLVIIESKSLSEKCSSCEILQKHDIQRANSCSKYSLGVIYSGIAKKYDTFIETMKKIKEIRLDTLKNRFRRTSLHNILNNNYTSKEELNIEEEISELLVK